MKKRIAAFLLSAILLAGILPAYADDVIYEELGAVTAGINHKIAAYSKSSYTVPVSATNQAMSIASTMDANGNIKVSTGIILRFDISEVPLNADKVSINLGVSNRSSNVYSKFIREDGLTFGLYALDCLKENWSQNDAWANISNVSDMSGDDFTKTRVGGFRSDDRVVYTDTVNAASTLYGGFRFECDLTSYILSERENEKEYIDLFLAIDDFDRTNNIYSTTDGSGNSTAQACFMPNSYSPDSTDTNGRSNPLRPRLHWYSIVRDEVNTIENLSVKNGELFGKFDKNCESGHIYDIIVNDELSPVSLSFDLTSPKSYLSGEIIEGMVGDTLRIPVISEAGETREYVFRLCSAFDMESGIFPEREYVVAGENIAIKNQRIDPETKTVYPITGSTEGMDMVSTLDNGNISVSKGIIIRYDISKIPDNCGKVVISLGVANRQSKTFSKYIEGIDFTVGIYAMPYMKEEWNQNDAWEDISEQPDLSSAKFTEKKVGEFRSVDKKVHIDKVNSESTMYGGYIVEADVSEYVLSQVAEGKDYVDLFYAIESFDPSGAQVTTSGGKKSATAYFMVNTYSPGSDDSERTYPIRPIIKWFDIVPDKINTAEKIAFTNGAIADKFDKNADSAVTYKVVCNDENKTVKLKYILSSGYSSVDENEAVLAGMVGETLVLPIISEAGEKRVYKFNIISKEEAGFSEDNILKIKKISCAEGENGDISLMADAMNSSFSSEKAYVVLVERNGNKLINAKYEEMVFAPGYSEKNISLAVDEKITSKDIYIASGRDILTPISPVEKLGENSGYDKKNSYLQVYSKDIYSNDISVAGKMSGAKKPFAAFIVDSDSEIESCDAESISGLLEHSFAGITDENGYYGFDATLSQSGNYKIYVCAEGENKAEKSFYFATRSEREELLFEIYSSKSANELSDKLALSLTDEERKALADKYEETNGKEGQRDCVRTLMLIIPESDISGFIKILYGFILNDNDKTSFGKYYADAMNINKVNAGDMEDISELSDAAELDKDIMKIYDGFSNTAKKDLSANKLAGREFQSYKELKADAETEILLCAISEIGNTDGVAKIISQYPEKLGISLAAYNKLNSAQKQTVISAVVAAAPYNTKDSLNQKFNSEVSQRSGAQNNYGGSVGGAGARSGGIGPNQNIEVSGVSESDLSPDKIDNRRICRFTDLDGYEWAADAIISLYEKAIIDGINASEYSPACEVKREEFLKMADTLYEGNPINAALSDVDSDAWYGQYVLKALGSGVAKGFGNNLFGIGKPITREDMAVMINRMLKLENSAESGKFGDDEEISDYARQAVYNLKNAGLVSGDENGNYRPKKYLSRAAAAVVINNTLRYIAK